MTRRSRIVTGLAAAAVVAVAGLTALPLLGVASDSNLDGGRCAASAELAGDGTPTILGSAALTVRDLTAWWAATGRGQPSRLALPVGDFVALYLSEGETEGVRGDFAFAQAILETGYFTNGDTSRNNFAGIAHYDDNPAGIDFRDVVAGVRAHIQLLKKYALGNDAPLARPNVAPDAGARSSTWRGLAGTWASSPEYWTSLDATYRAMAEQSASADPVASPATSTSLPCSTGLMVTYGDYTLPVERRWYDEHPDWFGAPHHDYPAIDIPVPTGTPLYAVTNGVVVSTPSTGRCGIGIVINGDDGAQYVYCHGRPGSQAVTTGERVRVGHEIMASASTGNSTGPHLHFGIRVDGTDVCPQLFLTAIASGQQPDPRALPRSGCTH